MAFHENEFSGENAVQFGQLSFRDGVVKIPAGVNNDGIKVTKQVQVVSGFFTKIQKRTQESQEYGVSDSLTLYFHDNTAISFTYATNQTVNYRAAHLMAKLLAASAGENGFGEEVFIRMGMSKAGEVMPDGKKLEQDNVWSSVRCPALSDDPLRGYYGQGMEGLPETPVQTNGNGQPIMNGKHAVRDHSNLYAWVQGAAEYLISKADETAEVNRQRGKQQRAQQEATATQHMNDGINPAELAAAEQSVNHQNQGNGFQAPNGQQAQAPQRPRF